MDTRDPIRRRPDGSIDTAFYLAAGRVARAEQARRLAAAIRPRSEERQPLPWSRRSRPFAG